MKTIKKLGNLILILTISLPCFAKKKVEFKGDFRKWIKSLEKTNKKGQMSS